MIIKVADLNDVKGIVDVHTSDVTRWFKYLDDRKVEAPYEELSIEDRWRHGGPWMSVETCAIHINYLLLYDQYPLVAILDDNVVGELELYINFEAGKLGWNGYIDVLEVHHKYRGIGIGRALVNRAIEIAREAGCNTVSVWPDKDVINFYRKCGFKDIAFDIKYIEIQLRKFQCMKDTRVESYPNDYKTIMNLNFITPRIHSSYAAFLKTIFRYALDDYMEIIDKGYLTRFDTAYYIERRGAGEIGYLWLWIGDEKLINDTLKFIFKIAGACGIRKLRLYVSSEIYRNYLKNYSHKILGNEYMLVKRL